MADALAERLAAAVEVRCGGKASLNHVQQVHLDLEDGAIWDGVIHVFDLDRHQTAQRVYAWPSAIGGRTPSIHVVLHSFSIESAQDAARRTLFGRRQSAPSTRQP